MPISVDPFFQNSDPSLRAAYDALLEALGQVGFVREDIKDGEIVLERNDKPFVSIQPQDSYLNLSFSTNAPLHNTRVTDEQIGTSLYRHIVKLTGPANIDEQLIQWLSAAYVIEE